MSPEYGATCGFFPVDELTLDYLRLTGRSDERVALVEAYCRENLLWHEPDGPPGVLAGGRARPRRRRAVARRAAPAAGPRAARAREAVVPRGAADLRRRARTTSEPVAETFPASDPTTEQAPGGHEVEHAPVAVAARPRPRTVRCEIDGESHELGHGAVVIAAITSCTNTSNPQVMVAAGLLAKRAVELGLRRAPWVKTSLAPGSRVVTDYYERAGLQTYLDELGFNTVGYGCTTCIGNSGPLPPEVSQAISDGDLVAAPCSPATGTSRRGSIPR